nr:ankyrin repeat protein [Pandoravirus massiliensis]
MALFMTSDALARVLFVATILSAAILSGGATSTSNAHSRLIDAAARCDRVAIERILAQAPRALTGQSPDGSGTALHAVARAPSTDACLDTAAALLRAGADPLALDDAGRTAVDVARRADAALQRPDRPPMGLFLEAAATGERKRIMRDHGPLVDDTAVPPPRSV